MPEGMLHPSTEIDPRRRFAELYAICAQQMARVQPGDALKVGHQVVDEMVALWLRTSGKEVGDRDAFRRHFVERLCHKLGATGGWRFIPGMGFGMEHIPERDHYLFYRSKLDLPRAFGAYHRAAD